MSVMLSLSGASGMWSSSSSAVLEVEPRTGAAVARDKGTVTVYYDIPGQLRTYREVSACTLVQISKLITMSSFRDISNNIFRKNLEKIVL